MTNEQIKDLYINWEGLEFFHSCKYILRIFFAIISTVFVFISVKINNTYLLLGSLIVLFLQILSQNNKEYYLKYKEIYEKSKKGNIKNYRSWINFLEKTKGLNSFSKKIMEWLFKNNRRNERNGKRKNN